LIGGNLLKMNDLLDFDGVSAISMDRATSVVITGCDSMAILQQAVQAAPSFLPMGCPRSR
jgi:hypothetical protein